MLGLSPPSEVQLLAYKHHCKVLRSLAGDAGAIISSMVSHLKPTLIRTRECSKPNVAAKVSLCREVGTCSTYTYTRATAQILKKKELVMCPNLSSYLAGFGAEHGICCLAVRCPGHMSRSVVRPTLCRRQQ
jgi:hypothetical protein